MEAITDLKHILHSKRANIYYKEAHLRVENLLRKSWIWLYFSLIIVKYTYIRLKLLKNLSQTSFPSLRFLLLDKLQKCRALQQGVRVVYCITTNVDSLKLRDAINKQVEFDLFKKYNSYLLTRLVINLKLSIQEIKNIKKEMRT